jgi:hypothetical protein
VNELRCPFDHGPENEGSTVDPRMGDPQFHAPDDGLTDVEKVQVD